MWSVFSVLNRRIRVTVTYMTEVFTASLKEQKTTFCCKKKEKTIFYHLEATTLNSLVVFF